MVKGQLEREIECFFLCLVYLVCGYGLCTIICNVALDAISLQKDRKHLAVGHSVFKFHIRKIDKCDQLGEDTEQK